MKLLLIHNWYRSHAPSGENRVVEEEAEWLLRQPGIELETFFRHSDEISLRNPRAVLDAGFGPLGSPLALRAFRQLVESFRPDVAHVHNVFPLISPGALQILHSAGVPTVATLHNYRSTCIKGTHFRDSQQCFKCVGSIVNAPAIQHSCYRGSRLQSIPMAVGSSWHHGSWARTRRLLCVSEFQRSRLRSLGVAGNLFVKPNSVPDPGVVPRHGDGVAYVGRLSEEKGVRELMLAWKLAGHESSRPLRIIGDGPLLEHLQLNADSSVEFVGQVHPSRIPEMLDGYSIVVVPSLWEETFGRSAAEGLALSRIVIASTRGALPEVIHRSAGDCVDPTPDSLAAAILRQLRLGEFRRRGALSRATFEARYQIDAVGRLLVQHYEQVVDEGAHARRGEWT